MKRIFLFLIWIGTAYAHGPPLTELTSFEEKNWKSWQARECFGQDDFNFPDKINPALLELICSAFRFVQDGRPLTFWKIQIHSDYRGLLSQHNTGNAIDFHLSSYAKRTECQSLKIFMEDYLLLQEVLRASGAWGIIGFGIYPNQKNPFFHVDIRGKRARWARLTPSGGNYVAIENGIRWIRERVDELRIDDQC